MGGSPQELAHAGVCPRAPPFANALVRHNLFAESLAALAQSCGRRVTVHDRPIGGGFLLRPADLLEAPTAAHPVGLGIDVTVVCATGVATLRNAALAKERKYQLALSHNPALKFKVFAVSEAGWMTRDAESVLSSWAASRDLDGSRVGPSRPDVVAAAGACYAVSWMFQVAGWGSGPRAVATAPSSAVRRYLARQRPPVAPGSGNGVLGVGGPSTATVGDASATADVVMPSPMSGVSWRGVQSQASSGNRLAVGPAGSLALVGAGSPRDGGSECSLRAAPPGAGPEEEDSS